MPNLCFRYEMSAQKSFNNTRPETIGKILADCKRQLTPALRGWTLVFSLLFTLILPSPASAAPRTWTNLRGDQITASLKEVREKEILLETSGGTEIEYPRWALVPEDQAFISTWVPFLGHQIGALLVGDLVVLNDDDDLTDAEGNPLPLAAYQDPPDDPLDVVALYFSAGFSPYCREFTPELVDFYKKNRRKHQNFEVILVDSDPSRDEMVDYMEDFDMPWPAVSYRVARDLPRELVRLRNTGIPNLVLVARDGHVISDAFRDGEYVGPSAVLETFQTLLEHGVPVPESEEAPETATEPASASASAEAADAVPSEPLPIPVETATPAEPDSATIQPESPTAPPAEPEAADEEPAQTQTQTPFGTPAASNSETGTGTETEPATDAADNPFGTTTPAE